MALADERIGTFISMPTEITCHSAMQDTFLLEIKSNNALK